MIVKLGARSVEFFLLNVRCVTVSHLLILLPKYITCCGQVGSFCKYLETGHIFSFAFLRYQYFVTDRKFAVHYYEVDL